MLSQRITSQDIPKLLYQLESAPFIDNRELRYYVGHKGSIRSYRWHEFVPVAKIISAPVVENWGRVKDHRRTDPYIAAMAQAMLTGKLDLNALPPALREYAGAYYVTADGITRCAVAKLLGMKLIPADVTYVHATLTCTADTPDEYKTLLERQQQGLWQGSMTTYHTRSSIPFFRRFICAIGEVTDYEGVWVFAKNVEQAKQIYQAVGASGKLLKTPKEDVTEMRA